MYVEITQGIQIEVQPSFVPERSKPELSYYFFSYRIKITNLGENIVQLIGRHWIITDGQGKVHVVKGPGVVGDQPILAPGQSYDYTSFCPLTTATGSMRGTYQMLGPNETEFNVKIPLFFLRDMSKFH